MAFRSSYGHQFPLAWPAAKPKGFPAWHFSPNIHSSGLATHFLNAYLTGPRPSLENPSGRESRRHAELPDAVSRAKGHQVHPARDIATALDLALTLNFDILISDITLPDGDGWRLLHQMDPKPFGIAMSGFGSHSDKEKEPGVGV